MSIDVIGVSHSMASGGRAKRRLEFRDINMHIEENERVAILAKEGAGLSELLAIICRAVVPARGDVLLSSEISWPIGESRFLTNDLSLATNLRFLSRIYETNESEYIERVGEVAGLTTEEWNERFGGFSRERRWRFAFALGVCLPFDIYIFESVETRDREYREKSAAVVEQLARDFGIVVTTSSGDVARRYCDRGFVLDGGKISYYEDIEEAIEHLERAAEPAAGEFIDEGEVEERDEDELDVI